jgi:hypothetical protein
MTIPMHTALIFKEQAKVKDIGLRERAYPNLITQYNILKDMIFFVTNMTTKICITQSLREGVRFWYHEYLLHPGQTRTEKTIRKTVTWTVLTQDVEHGLFMFHLSSMSYDKERTKIQEI